MLTICTLLLIHTNYLINMILLTLNIPDGYIRDIRFSVKAYQNVLEYILDSIIFPTKYKEFLCTCLVYPTKGCNLAALYLYIS